MLAHVLSAVVRGLGAFPGEVEVNSAWGNTVMVIVGLSDIVVKENHLVS
jgi:hypothetical protein